MSNGLIFISYRREDSAGYARALYDRLVQHFSKERVFIDVDAIEPGLPFDDAINRAIDQCAVVLVVIGRRWMDERPGIGPRINDPQDFVRLEVAAALSRDIRVIPVLLDGAAMPGEEDLPEPLRPLSRRNALEISNSRFASDTEKLIQTIRKALGDSGSIAQEAHIDITGEWEADVAYDWPNANYVEKFDFEADENDVYGTASFLGRKRGILEGSIKKDRLRFITRTREHLGGDTENPRDVVHRYRGVVLGNEIKFVMQTEGGYSEHIPIEFRARKVPDKPGP